MVRQKLNRRTIFLCFMLILVVAKTWAVIVKFR